MRPARSLLPALRPALIAALLVTGASSAALGASSSTARKPVILDSQGGINDGESGTVLQTAPLSRQPIVNAQPMAAPAELAPNSSTPIVVAPYIQLPVGGGTTTAPATPSRPSARPQ